VKSLPPAEQDAVCRALVGRRKPKQTSWQRTPDGGYYNPDGLPDDHPFFKILAEDEAASLILVTRNVRHFDHVAGLQVENWFEKPGAADQSES